MHGTYISIRYARFGPPSMGPALALLVIQLTCGQQHRPLTNCQSSLNPACKSQDACTATVEVGASRQLRRRCADFPAGAAQGEAIRYLPLCISGQRNNHCSVLGSNKSNDGFAKQCRQGYIPISYVCIGNERPCVFRYYEDCVALPTKAKPRH